MGGAVLFNMAAFALMRASSGAPLIKPGSVSDWGRGRGRSWGRPCLLVPGG